MSKNTTFSLNKNAIIASRIDRSGKLRTETQRRDAGTLDFAVSTDEHNNSTRLFIDGIYADNGTIALSGHEARSLYRLLRKHYRFAGKPRKG